MNMWRHISGLRIFQRFELTQLVLPYSSSCYTFQHLMVDTNSYCLYCTCFCSVFRTTCPPLVITESYLANYNRLKHGRARVAHCVSTRWRNLSHYCRPLRHYDVWFTCLQHREALLGAPTTRGVHKQEFTVQGGSTYFATEQVGRLRYVTAVDGGLEAFPLSIVICASVG